MEMLRVCRGPRRHLCDRAQASRCTRASWGHAHISLGLQQGSGGAWCWHPGPGPPSDLPCTGQRVGLCWEESAQGIRILCSGPGSRSELQAPWFHLKSHGFTQMASPQGSPPRVVETSTALRREGLFPHPPPPTNPEPCYFWKLFAPRAHTQDPRVPGPPPYKCTPVRVTGRHHSEQTREPAGG